MQVQTWFKVGVKVRVRHSFVKKIEAGERVCICSSTDRSVCVCLLLSLLPVAGKIISQSSSADSNVSTVDS